MPICIYTVLAIYGLCPVGTNTCQVSQRHISTLVYPINIQIDGSLGFERHTEGGATGYTQRVEQQETHRGWSNRRHTEGGATGDTEGGATGDTQRVGQQETHRGWGDKRHSGLLALVNHY